MKIEMIYIYFNGDFYYRSKESHYKHGRVILTCFSDEEATKEIEKLNENL